MSKISESLKNTIDFPRFLNGVKAIDLESDAWSKEEKRTLQGFLLFPFLMSSCAGDTVHLKKNDVRYIKKYKNSRHIIEFETDTEITRVFIGKYESLFSDVFYAWHSRLEENDYFFMPEKKIKYRYQAFSNMLKKTYPLPLFFDNENFTKKPLTELKEIVRSIGDVIYKV